MSSVAKWYKGARALRDKFYAFGGTMAKRFSSLVLVLTMSLFLLFGIGVTAFAAGDNESVTAVTSPDPSTFTVVQGTERGDIGLPSTLSATITTSASQEGAENSTHTQDLNVM
jgi:K+-transporting ATPase A subunit